jgi:hypothetical protein
MRGSDCEGGGEEVNLEIVEGEKGWGEGKKQTYLRFRPGANRDLVIH